MVTGKGALHRIVVWLNARFAPPHFENETDRLAAEALNTALWLGGALLALLIGWQVIIGGRTGNIAIKDELVGLGIVLLGHWLLLRGWLRWVGGITVSLGWLLMTGDILFRHGLLSPNLAAETIMVFVAGLLVNGRFALTLAALSIAVNAIAARAHLQGVLSYPPGDPDPLSRWFVVSIYIALAAFFVVVIRRYLDGSIRRSELSDHLYQALFRSTTEAVVLLDKEGRIHRINRRGADMLGYTAETLIGRSLTDLVTPRYRETLLRFLPRVLAGQDIPVYEIELLTREEAMIPVEVSTGVVLDGDLKPILVQNLLRDVSERKRTERTLRYHATHDRLTGLLNRAQFETSLNNAVERARREGTQLALLFIDLDDLKKINDEFGHAGGDELIRTAALRLAMSVRTGDVLARQSGDEFVVLLEPLHGLGAAETLGERILKKVSDPMEVGGKLLHASCSIGVSLFPQDAPDGPALMRAADLAMYAAKRAGKNRMHLFQQGDWERLGEAARGHLTREETDPKRQN
ncbi:MAG: sensor domain-containing diguanylate cyclase [Anaerolineae bacterium]|nr:MAG: sensor domain-containing diguanylate cyclase [Anaerolineae bacterium]